MTDEQKETTGKLSAEDLKLLVEFFTILAEWNAKEMNSQQENSSQSEQPSLEAS